MKVGDLVKGMPTTRSEGEYIGIIVEEIYGGFLINWSGLPGNHHESGWFLSAIK